MKSMTSSFNFSTELSDLALHAERVKNDIQNSCRLVLYGCGTIGKTVAKEISFFKPVFFTDSNPALIGTTECGIRILAWEDVVAEKNTFIVLTLATRYQKIVAEKVKAANLKFCTLHEFLFICNKEEYIETLESLADEDSVSTYINILKANFYLENSFFEKVKVDSQYFCLPDFQDSEVLKTYIDIGACFGESLEAYFHSCRGMSKDIYLFEPGEQYFALKKRVSRLCKEWCFPKGKIHCIKKAIANDVSLSYFTVRGRDVLPGSFLENHSNKKSKKIRILTLDSFLLEKRTLKTPVLLKVSVEGAELSVLKSARSFIIQYKPLIAVCIYHRIQDFYEIPLYIKSLNLGYNFSVRHHSFSDGQTVLYCY